MEASAAYIYTPSSVSTWYECALYLTPPSAVSQVRVGDILTDTSANEYSVFGFFNPSIPAQDETTNLFQDGWTVKLNWITANVLPAADTGYDSSIESPVIPSYLPDVSWGAFASNIVTSIPAYTYQCDLSVNSSGDPGAGSVAVDYFMVDFDGNIYRIIQVISVSSPTTVRLYDINELPNNPPSSNLGYVYQPKRGSTIMSQAKYYVLDQAARDKANNIEKAVAWEHRGLELQIGQSTYTNVTKLDVTNMTHISDATNGWQGGIDLLSETEGANKIIQGQSGFASHYVDGGANDVNSFIDYDPTDGVHYHRIEPKVDSNYLDIRIGFQFPSTFTGLRDSGNVFEFYGKADNGSGDAANILTLTKLIGVDGTEYAVSGKSTTSTSRTLLSLTKAEVDSILNPITSSSSSSSGSFEWNSDDAGKLVFAEFRLFGNDGDKIYLDNDKDFMYTL